MKFQRYHHYYFDANANVTVSSHLNANRNVNSIGRGHSNECEWATAIYSSFVAIKQSSKNLRILCIHSQKRWDRENVVGNVLIDIDHCLPCANVVSMYLIIIISIIMITKICIYIIYTCTHCYSFWYVLIQQNCLCFDNKNQFGKEATEISFMDISSICVCVCIYSSQFSEGSQPTDILTIFWEHKSMLHVVCMCVRDERYET